MGRHGTVGSGSLGCLSDHSNLGIGVSVEAIDAHHRVNTGCSNDVDVVHHIGDALLQKSQVLFSVGIRQGYTSYHLRSTAMHLQRPDGSGEHRHMRLETAVATLDIPELLNRSR
ncbi:hypothetical protein ES703_71186 [subsurface metagenome]